jgi:site-specific recombinase XerD
MNPFYPYPQTHQHIYAGPLGPIIDVYAALLHQRGYKRQSARVQIRLISDFSRWIERQRLTACRVSHPVIDRYLRSRYQQYRPRRDDRSTLNRVVALLREKGIVRDPIPTTIHTPLQQIEDDFKRYLAQERGLSLAAQVNYLPFILNFLHEHFGRGPIRFTRLYAKDVIGFVQRHAPHLGPKRAGLMGTALRTFLRYLQLRGEIASDLASCVPSVANWQLSTLPKFLQPHQVQCVLDHCDRQTPQGQRDYAILLVLARLGVRACEVVALTLDDINWNAAELTIQGKGPRRAKLPLPHDVGEALALYLKQGRPSCSSRRVFIRLRAPIQGFANSIAISTLVARALKRAGVESPCTGAHLFRHTLATQMLHHGASLEEISQLLRHRSFNTTTLYAKVDLTALRPLAQPWPGGDL